MKLKNIFEYVDMGNGDFFGVPVGHNATEVQGVIKLNKTAKEIAEMLTEDITLETIVERLSKKYENSKSELIQYTKETVETLRKNDLIE